MRIVSRPVECLDGRVRVPGDKSISHRAAILGALAEGTTEVAGFLNSLDCRATLASLEALGVRIESSWNGVSGALGIEGTAGKLKAPRGALDFGNSGTSLRLMSGVLCGQDFASVLTGDESLRRRPMRRIVEPLARMGAAARTGAGGVPPVEIRPVPGLRCIDYRLPVASAQVKSCLLLASLFAEGVTVLTEDVPTRDHTERMLAAFGAPVSVKAGRIGFSGKIPLRAARIKVPGDMSSAAFLVVAACIAGEGELLIENVGVNPTRTGLITILKMMGADVEIVHGRDSAGCGFADEAVADLRVRASRLHGVTIPRGMVAGAIDEFPALFVAAACAEGVTELGGAAELRFKESDRIRAMADGLSACGVRVEEKPDGLTVTGGGIEGGEVDSHGDHRVAMAFAVAGAASRRGVTITGCEQVDTSFPGFVTTARALGLDLEQLR